LEENADMQTAINSSTATGQCGYVGLGFDVGTNIKDLNVYNSTNTIAYAATPLNIYCASTPGGSTPIYPFARFLFLLTPKYSDTTFTTPANPIADIANYINWLKQTDGQGQTDVVAEGFLKLAPDEDVNLDNAVDVSDLVAVGNSIGLSGALHWIRADVAGGPNGAPDGHVDVSDLVAVGNWVGATIIPAS
jgi:hypothetical protein